MHLAEYIRQVFHVTNSWTTMMMMSDDDDDNDDNDNGYGVLNFAASW